MRRGRCGLVATLVAVVVVGGFCGGAWASEIGPGDLDPKFGVGGRVSTDLPGLRMFVAGVASRPDGRLVVGGHSGKTVSNGGALSAVGYSESGRLDRRFGVNGVATAGFATPLAARAVLLQGDGKAIVVGTSYSLDRWGLARLTTGGDLDPEFGDGGKVTTAGPRPSFIGAAALAPDGKIVLAGSTRDDPGADTRTLVARYTPDGRLDSGFGSRGIAEFDAVPGNSDGASAVAVRADGRIVVVGSSRGTDLVHSLERPLVAGLTATGQPEFAYLPPFQGLGEESDLRSVALTRSGEVVAAGGTSSTSTGTYLLLAHPTGLRTTAFARAGITAQELTLDHADRPLIAASWFTAGNSIGTAILRYRADGALDPTFGPSGKRTVSFRGREPFPRGITMQPDGRIIVVATDDPTVPRDPDILLAGLRGGPDRRPPTIRITHRPWQCEQVRRRIRVRIAEHSPVERVIVSLDGRPIQTTPKERFTLRLRVPRGRHKLTVAARDIAGNRATRRLTVRRCS